ncbi:hypothetical protein GCM10020256_46430 [Streptomyces thermocoprophilus]
MLWAMRRWVGVSRCPSKRACNRLAGLSVALIAYSPPVILDAPGEYSAEANPNLFSISRYCIALCNKWGDRPDTPGEGGRCTPPAKRGVVPSAAAPPSA